MFKIGDVVRDKRRFKDDPKRFVVKSEVLRTKHGCKVVVVYCKKEKIVRTRDITYLELLSMENE
jgi:hypothetical protein